MEKRRSHDPEWTVNSWNGTDNRSNARFTCINAIIFLTIENMEKYFTWKFFNFIGEI